MAFPLFAPRRAQTAGGPPDAAEALAREASPPRKAAAAASKRSPHSYAREAAALVLLASALYTVLALTSFRGDPMRPEIVGGDWVGPVGATCAGALVETIGLAAWFIPIEIAFSLGTVFEMIEWGVAEFTTRELGETYVATQGDPWDTQSDMFFALIGAVTALLLLSPLHDRQLAGLASTERQSP